VDQTVDMRLVAVLSKEHSAAVGGTRVGGYMTTALSDRSGQLVIPMILTGTMTDPRFAPDLRRVAEMKLEDTLEDPLRGLGGLLDTLKRRRR
jgi:hypothetical protein